MESCVESIEERKFSGSNAKKLTGTMKQPQQKATCKSQAKVVQMTSIRRWPICSAADRKSTRHPLQRQLVRSLSHEDR